MAGDRIAGGPRVDESLVERWAQDVYFQFFSGQVHFEPRLLCDPTQICRFRRVLGEAGVEQLLKATIETAVAINAVMKTEFERVIVNTMVQSKAIGQPLDSRLLEGAREKIARLAGRAGIQLKQTYQREGQTLRRRAGGYAHAKQFKRSSGYGARSSASARSWTGCCATCAARCST